MTTPLDKGKAILWSIDPRTYRPQRWHRIKFDFSQATRQTGSEMSLRTRPAPAEHAREFVVPMRESDDEIAMATSCIYCNAKTKYPSGNAPLTEEHIIPVSIGGTKVISRASCQECMNCISSYETKIIASLFWTPSKVLGIKNPRKKKVLKGHPIYAFVGEDMRTFNLPLANHPGLLLLPTYHPPRHMVVDASSIVTVSGLWGNQINEELDWQAGLQALGFDGMATIGVDIIAFSKFIAKIAFGFAVAKFGQSWDEDGKCKIGGFDAITLEFIRERPPRIAPRYDFSFFDYIGGLGPANYERATHLHGASVSVENFILYDYICVYVQLFANLGAPIYKVLVAQRPARLP